VYRQTKTEEMSSNKDGQATSGRYSRQRKNDKMEKKGLPGGKGNGAGEPGRSVKPRCPPLPAEVVEMIAKDLSPEDLLSAAAVSRAWKAGCQK
jgi:hypothetical protein